MSVPRPEEYRPVVNELARSLADEWYCRPISYDRRGRCCKITVWSFFTALASEARKLGIHPSDLLDIDWRAIIDPNLSREEALKEAVRYLENVKTGEQMQMTDADALVASYLDYYEYMIYQHWEEIPPEEREKVLQELQRLRHQYEGRISRTIEKLREEVSERARKYEEEGVPPEQVLRYQVTLDYWLKQYPELTPGREVVKEVYEKVKAEERREEKPVEKPAEKPPEEEVRVKELRPEALEALISDMVAFLSREFGLSPVDVDRLKLRERVRKLLEKYRELPVDEATDRVIAELAPWLMQQVRRAREVVPPPRKLEERARPVAERARAELRGLWARELEVRERAGELLAQLGVRSVEDLIRLYRSGRIDATTYRVLYLYLLNRGLV